MTNVNIDVSDQFQDQVLKGKIIRAKVKATVHLIKLAYVTRVVCYISVSRTSP